MIEIFEAKPKNFTAHVDVAACYLEMDGCLLLLQQAGHKPEPGRWGVPAGKKERNETIETTAQRELFEETGIAISSFQLETLGCLYIRKPEVNYVYHMFRVCLNAKPAIHLSEEHQDYRWASMEALDLMPLMAGAKGALEKFRR